MTPEQDIRSLPVRFAGRARGVLEFVAVAVLSVCVGALVDPALRADLILHLS